MGQKEKQSGSYVVERSRTEDVKAVRNSLAWVACTATQGLGNIWTQSAAEGRVWVHCTTTARICVDIFDSCYH